AGPPLAPLLSAQPSEPFSLPRLPAAASLSATHRRQVLAPHRALFAVERCRCRLSVALAEGLALPPRLYHGKPVPPRAASRCGTGCSQSLVSVRDALLASTSPGSSATRRPHPPGGFATGRDRWWRCVHRRKG